MAKRKDLSSAKLIFVESLQSWSTDPGKTLLIYDRHLEKVSKEAQRWLRQYRYRYAVDSGERLKDIEHFAEHAGRLWSLAEDLSPKDMSVVAVGGGSVGDFAGFFASVFKRGVRLIHVPSTWLAAVDSSHGGKTALNIQGAKNQLGTFYPATQVVLVRSLLFSQPVERVRDAMGELGKIALIDGGAWTKSLMKTRLRGRDLLWRFLQPAIKAKLRVVAKDPLEQSGARQVLNLGHTIGHVLEAAHGWSHGDAIGQGLFFAIELSHVGGLLSAKSRRACEALLQDKLEILPRHVKPKLNAKGFLKLVTQDKKRTSRDELVFVVIRDFGRVERAVVPIHELLTEARRQGWVQ